MEMATFGKRDASRLYWLCGSNGEPVTGFATFFTLSTNLCQGTSSTVFGVVGVDTVAWTGRTFLGVIVVLRGVSRAGHCRAVGAMKDKKYA